IRRELQRLAAAKHCIDQRVSDAGGEQSCARFDGCRRIAGIQRSTIARLKEIDIPIASDVIRMSARAYVRMRLALERQPTAANRARENRVHDVRVHSAVESVVFKSFRGFEAS